MKPIHAWLLASSISLSVFGDPSLVKLYEELHANPELSYKEKDTASKLAQELKASGFEVTVGVGGHGVVGVLKNGAGRTLMLRADMDALPVEELTGLKYASKSKGVMHACGHDIHMANLVGVTRYLANHREEWKGTLVAVFQPAEEKGAGAKAMMKDGLFKRFPKPDFAVALHVSGEMATGTVGFHPGYALAAADSIDISIRGKGGHGALPHKAIDPVYLASAFVVDLQSLISREKDPVESAVLTVGSFHCGTKHNIISDRCDLQLTLRTFSPKVRTRLIEGLERKAKAIAMGAGAPEPVIKVDEEPLAALYNDLALGEKVVSILKKKVGEKNVIETPPVLAAEDFGRYAEGKLPIFLFWLGTIEPGRLKKQSESGKLPPLHSAQYYPDAEKALETGVPAMTAVAIGLLSSAP
ncbi:amidohydrolase [bacterium]|nr:amidohydrolase [bacterium]